MYFQSKPEIQIIYSQMYESAAGLPTSYDNWFLSTKTINDTEYLYLNYKLGQTRMNKSLGVCTPELRGQFEALLAGPEQQSLETARSYVQALIAIGGYAPTVFEGKVLHFLAQNDVFQSGTALVGTQAYALYQNILGIVYTTAAKTEDVDVLLGNTLSVAGTEKIQQALRTNEDIVRPVPQMSHKTPATDFRFSGTNLTLQFLTPGGLDSYGQVAEVSHTNLFALQMPHLQHLLKSITPAVVAHGTPFQVYVPLPQNYAVHKLAVAARPDRFVHKVDKDLMQAHTLCSYFLEYNPLTLEEAFAEALEDEAFCANIRRGLKKSAARHKESLERLMDMMPREFKLDQVKRSNSRRR